MAPMLVNVTPIETCTAILRWCATWSLRARFGGTPNERVVWRTMGFSGIRSSPQVCRAVARLHDLPLSMLTIQQS